MTPLHSEKYNIAWFKLAEFVVRGEKERALGIYRLLSHSLSDDAFACQLEGDLLLSFNDDKALEAFSKAALLYEKYMKFEQAAAVYENLIVLVPKKTDYYLKLVFLYDKLNNIHKKNKLFYTFLDLSLEQGLKADIDLAFRKNLFADNQNLLFYEFIIFKIIDKKLQDCNDILYFYLDKLLADKTYNLSSFLNKLKILDQNIYNYASNFINKKN